MLPSLGTSAAGADGAASASEEQENHSKYDTIDKMFNIKDNQHANATMRAKVINIYGVQFTNALCIICAQICIFCSWQLNGKS